MSRDADYYEQRAADPGEWDGPVEGSARRARLRSQFAVSFNPAEVDALRVAADVAEVSVAEFIHTAAMEKAARPVRIIVETPPLMH